MARMRYYKPKYGSHVENRRLHSEDAGVVSYFGDNQQMRGVHKAHLEKLAKKKAAWTEWERKMVEKGVIQLEVKPECSAYTKRKLLGGGIGVGNPCGNRTTLPVHTDGKFYCKIHHPELNMKRRIASLSAADRNQRQRWLRDPLRRLEYLRTEVVMALTKLDGVMYWTEVEEARLRLRDALIKMDDMAAGREVGNGTVTGHLEGQ